MRGIFPLGNRDFVVVSNKIIEPDGTIRIITKSIEIPEFPI